jgi:hypothetical protein
MKFLFLIFSLILSVGLFSKYNTDSITPNEPEHRTCECAGWFCSAELLCTDKEHCSCNCAVFQCKCSCKKDLQTINHSASVTAEQIARLQDFESFLLSLGSIEGNNLSVKIKSMRTNLNSKNYGDYYTDAEEAENILPQFSNENRQTINAWFSAKGSNIQI